MTIEDIENKSKEEESDVDTFWGRNGANIGLAVLVLYVTLLVLGTVAEIFNIDSILDWWIFRPPGRQ
ncbi:MAG: hypothetical protein RQ824_10625 [bacterium]|nr:hypothetical protein [bacterium]